MYYFNDKLLLSLLLSSALLIAHGDQDNKKEGSLNKFVLDTCENLPVTLLSLVVLKQYEKTLPAEKFLGAEILKRYIAYNTEYSEDTAETIAQCVVSPLSHIESKEKDNKTYEYTLNYESLISVPKTLARELLLNKFTRFCYKIADKLKLEIKHPPEIEKNKKLYLSGKFLIKSMARHVVDCGLSKLLSKINKTESLRS